MHLALVDDHPVEDRLRPDANVWDAQDVSFSGRSKKQIVSIAYRIEFCILLMVLVPNAAAVAISAGSKQLLSFFNVCNLNSERKNATKRNEQRHPPVVNK